MIIIIILILGHSIKWIKMLAEEIVGLADTLAAIKNLCAIHQ